MNYETFIKKYCNYIKSLKKIGLSDIHNDKFSIYLYTGGFFIFNEEKEFLINGSSEHYEPDNTIFRSKITEEDFNRLIDILDKYHPGYQVEDILFEMEKAIIDNV